jgi:hypothetical protein
MSIVDCGFDEGRLMIEIAKCGFGADAQSPIFETGNHQSTIAIGNHQSPIFAIDNHQSTILEIRNPQSPVCNRL